MQILNYYEHISAVIKKSRKQQFEKSELLLLLAEEYIQFAVDKAQQTTALTEARLAHDSKRFQDRLEGKWPPAQK